jgi:hypothetical protein
MTAQPQPTVSVPVSFVSRLDTAGRILRNLARELETYRSGKQRVPKDQAWFWSDEWQAGEREADQALANGEYQDFDDIDEALAWLHAQS